MGYHPYGDPAERLRQEVQRLIKEGVLQHDLANDRLIAGPANRVLSKSEWLDKMAAQKGASAPQEQMCANQQYIQAPPRHMNTRLLLTRKA